MKKILLDENLNKYKANLHCHTNISDGEFTPEQIKELYKKHGYSVVAFTDHDIFLAHDDLNDDIFLALHGYEMEFYAPKAPGKTNKTCHICLIQKDPKNMTQVCWNRQNGYFDGNGELYKDQAVFDETQPDFWREYTPEKVSQAIKIARDNGFFVTYNHPTWSVENFQDYMNFHGMHAMEISNYSSAVDGFDEYNPRVYDDMLRGGKRIYCIGADDNHNYHSPDSPYSDSCGAYIVLFAKELTYSSIMDSLFSGNFYSSQGIDNGPQIHSLYYEDGKVHIKCSPAVKVSVTGNSRRAFSKLMDKELITDAVLDIPPDNAYFRVTVVDEHGNHANSNAYFIDEIEK